MCIIELFIRLTFASIYEKSTRARIDIELMLIGELCNRVQVKEMKEEEEEKKNSIPFEV